MEEKSEVKNEPLNDVMRPRQIRKSRKSHKSYKPSELLTKLNDVIGKEVIVESPEQSVHDDPDLTRFIGITDLIQAKKEAKLNIENDLINALKESDDKMPKDSKDVKNLLPGRSVSNRETKTQDAKTEVRRVNSADKKVHKNLETKNEIKRITSHNKTKEVYIKRTDSESKLPPKIPVPRLYSNQPQKIIIDNTEASQSAVFIESKKLPSENNAISNQELKILVKKFKKILIIFGIAVFVLIVVSIVLSVVLSAVITNSCLIKKCDSNITSQAKILSSFNSSTSTVSSSLVTVSSQISSQLITNEFIITTTSTTTTKSNLPILRKNCDYGYSGVNCEDECGLIYSTPNVKIVGGVEALPNSWPSTALIYFTYRSRDIPNQQTASFTCGGTLIDRLTILTAGHCIFDKVYYQNLQIPVVPNEFYPTLESMFKVYLGVHDRTLINFVQNISPAIQVNVRKIIRHENFNDRNNLNDIAILKLEQYIEFNQYIQPACLPRSTEKYPDKINISAWAVGWGATGFGGSTVQKLRNVKLTVYDEKLCANVISLFEKNWSSQMCAGEYLGGRDTCQGDSGGSLYTREIINNKVKYIASGIVSYGEGCGFYQKPGIYTRISFFLDWIKENSG
ncbi:unnamed protein product [Brachionus calyciflorus]|uniref:Acrosin n=1 Tax=Brachionus calyciflorus TaxID=104777 RepID=A0A813WMJ2_9BILA|nr:unnamed protein product [Brachionus calyciflorus]